MVILGYQYSTFVGKEDQKKHTCLKVVFALRKDDDTHQGYYYCKDYNFIDKDNDFYKMITKYYKEGKELDLLFNAYGKVAELRLKS